MPIIAQMKIRPAAAREDRQILPAPLPMRKKRRQEPAAEQEPEPEEAPPDLKVPEAAQAGTVLPTVQREEVLPAVQAEAHLQEAGVQGTPRPEKHDNTGTE